MPKPATFPTLYDEVKTLSISLLKKHGYLNPNQKQWGIVTWNMEGRANGSISIAVTISQYATYLILDYGCNGENVHYRVDLVRIPSNLRKGHIWYFVCPKTQKRCRKLYLVENFFYHREAFSGCMYSKQTLSKRSRLLDRSIALVFGSEAIENRLHKKHLKKHYAGKPTKRYLILLHRLEEAERIDFRELEILLLK